MKLSPILIEQLINKVRQNARNPSFIHHWWFVKYHLEIVEKISMELCERYPRASRDLVMTLVWIHDYGKIMDFHDQYSKTLTAGRVLLSALGFPEETINTIMNYIEIFDTKNNLQKAPIEIQIVSSADGASHFIGPFYKIYWKEFQGMSYDELLMENIRKATTDWEKKIVLPEVKKAFAIRYRLNLEQSGKLPDKYIE